MSAETPTAADIAEQIDGMLDDLHSLELSAMVWRKVAHTEELRSKLYDIQRTASKLIDDVCSLS